MDAAPAPFESLPLEILQKIGQCLKASEMHGVTTASKYLRTGFLRSMFHTVSFAGNQMELLKKLERFQMSEHLESTRLILPLIKHVTMKVHESLIPTPFWQRMLACMIQEVLGSMKWIRGLDLQLSKLTDLQKEDLRDFVNAHPGWEHLRLVHFETGVDTHLFATLASKAPRITGVELDYYATITEVEAVEDVFPNLKQLQIFYMPVPELLFMQDDDDDDDNPNVVTSHRSMNERFPHVETLSIYWAGIFEWETHLIRSRFPRMTKLLIGYLKRWPNLKRFAATYPVEALASWTFRNPQKIMWTEVFIGICKLITLIAESVKHLDEITMIDEHDGMAVYRGIRGDKGKIKITIDFKCDKHAFPLGLMY
ncbi:hypothetical protein F53441_8079 [Fusarium austroafricanum]|uniref:F-box domain-containing protein n=1 Tax=Fusarium austroafricanum TaxID=2364996 RepID=A0A8H4KF49_9HYPO|nr:hypothetical protein F53441_8079 [Fusarium austroafricanum]